MASSGHQKEEELDALYGDVSGLETNQGGGGVGAEAELAAADKGKGGEQQASGVGTQERPSLEDAYQKYQPSRQEPTKATKAQDPSTSADPGGSVSVYIGNLQWWTTDAEIESACSDCGKIKGIKFFEEKSNGKSKGYVLVTFVDAAGALACQKKVHGLELNGKPIVAALQHQNSNKQQKQGAYGGHSAGGPMGGNTSMHQQQQRSTYGAPYGRGRGYLPPSRPPQGGGSGYVRRPYGGRAYGRGAPRQYGNRYQ